MLVVDVHALHPVHPLDLLDQIILDLLGAADGQHIMGIDRAFGNALAPLDILALFDSQPAAEGNEVRAGIAALLVGDNNVAVLFDLLEGNLAVDLVDDGHMLGLAALEQLLHAGKTLGDVVGAGNAAGVEGTHGQLGARFANGLSGDNAHGLAHGDRLAVSQRGAVALAAHAVLGPAVQHRADLDALHAPAGNQLGVVVVHQLILGHQHIAVFVAEILHQITANETLLQRLDGLGTRGNLKDLQALGSAAVVLQNDDLLGDIHQTAGQVTGVGGTQSRIRQALPGASEEMKYSKMVRPSR